jgi:glycosyltransferase involved in cell wall biosynthesis
VILFYRKFKRLRGGHLKVWDYFRHVADSPRYLPRVWFTENSRWDVTNPWRDDREAVVEDPSSLRPEALFLAGRDWVLAEGELERLPGIPVINLVQHVRHADPSSDRFEFLSEPAVRICVSEAVAEAVRASGRARGPVIAIPNGVDLAALPVSGGRDIDLLIAGAKQPALAGELERRLRRNGRRVTVLAEIMPRPDYLDAVSRARVTVFLPNPEEGYYLPTLEGMAMGTLVVCPHHAGEHALYEDGDNCFRSEYGVSELEDAAERALALGDAPADAMRAHARTTAEGHDIAVERRAFHEVLGNLEALWAETRR